MNIFSIKINKTCSTLLHSINMRNVARKTQETTHDSESALLFEVFFVNK